MNTFNIITRRGFLAYAGKAGVLAALSSLVDIPLVAKRALAANSQLGLNGKKLLFIFLRGANDGLNSVIPVQDPGYYTSRPTLDVKPNGIGIPKDPALDYSLTGPADFPVNSDPAAPVFSYPYAIRTGNGFMALHPSLKFLAPVYNSGDLALVHRVAYPKQSRSHFDSQNYWENGNPNNNMSKDGIFYRTIIESGLANTNPLTGVSFQNSLPLSLRGSKAAMTNLSDPSRYSLLGVPNTAAGNIKADLEIRAGDSFSFPWKRNRDLLELQFKNMTDTMDVFAQIDFSGTYTDDANTDGDTGAYNLFPTSNAQNGGYALHNNAANKYVVPTGSYGFFNELKSAALVLNKTNAIIAGTELGGFDTHNNQGGVTGQHANLQRTIAWAMYGLKKYFTKYSDKVKWEDVVVVTLSEFGRTSDQNDSGGTDHAEANVMFLAGGAIKGYQKGNSSGIFGGSPSDSVAWVPGPSTTKGTTMYAAAGRYLKRAIDYRSVLGKVIRDHLGASQDQLSRIIPGYANAGEMLASGGTSTIDKTPIIGEIPIV